MVEKMMYDQRQKEVRRKNSCLPPPFPPCVITFSHSSPSSKSLSWNFPLPTHQIRTPLLTSKLPSLIPLFSYFKSFIQTPPPSVPPSPPLILTSSLFPLFSPSPFNSPFLNPNSPPISSLHPHSLPSLQMGLPTSDEQKKQGVLKQ